MLFNLKNLDAENEVPSKSFTKFPPLKKNKNEEEMAESGGLDIPAPPILDKKLTEPDRKSMTLSQNSFAVRKFNIKRKT